MPGQFINAQGQLKVKSLDELGDYQICVEKIEPKMIGEEKCFVVTMANRSKALVELSKYIGLMQESNSIDVNVNVNSGVLLVKDQMSENAWEDMTKKKKNKEIEVGI